MSEPRKYFVEMPKDMRIYDGYGEAWDVYYRKEADVIYGKMQDEIDRLAYELDDEDREVYRVHERVRQERDSALDRITVLEQEVEQLKLDLVLAVNGLNGWQAEAERFKELLEYEQRRGRR